MKNLLIFLSLSLALPVSTFAGVAGPLFTYEGLLTDASGNPITTTQDISLQIIYPNSPDCVLMEETHTVLPGSNGEFSVVVGTGTRTDSTNNTADRIFATSGSINCSGASPMTANGYQTRLLRINVSGTNLSPDIAINNVPFAINASRLEDKGAADFVQTNAIVTQNSLESILNIYPSSLPAAGQFLISDGTNFQPGSLQAGTNITISPSGNSLIISSTGGGTAGITSLSTSSPLSINSSLGPVTGGSATLSILPASGSSDGYLSSTDWNIFNSKLSTVSLADIPDLPWSKITSGKPTTLDGYGITDAVYTGSSVNGDLTGTILYPTVTKIHNRPFANTSPTNGQVYIWDGTQFAPAYFGIGNLKTTLGNQQFPSACSSAQTLTWSAITDVFSCIAISGLDATAITTGIINEARLPASATYWQPAGGGISYLNPVGIGTNAPQGRLHVATTGSQSFIINKAISSTNPSDAATFLGIRSRDTGLPQQGDIIAEFMGSSEIPSLARAGMAVKASEPHSASSKGMMLEFLVSPLNSTEGRPAFVIRENGNAGLGNFLGINTNVGYLPSVTNWNTLPTNIFEITGKNSSPSIYSHGALLLSNNGGVEGPGDDLGAIYFGHKSSDGYGLHATIKGTTEGTTPNSGGRLAFLTKNSQASGLTERMRIDSNGNVGIGITSPLAKLDVDGAGIFSGNVGIGTTFIPAEKLHVIGNIVATGTVTANGVQLSSDLRFKKDIKVLEGALEKILSLRGVNYRWRTDKFPSRHFSDKQDMGVIAQEVEEFFPEAVVTAADGYKAVSYSKLVSPLIESTKELYGLCKATEEQLNAVQRSLASLKEDSRNKDLRIKMLEEENSKLKSDIDLIKRKLGIH